MNMRNEMQSYTYSNQRGNPVMQNMDTNLNYSQPEIKGNNSVSINYPRNNPSVLNDPNPNYPVVKNNQLSGNQQYIIDS